MVFTRVEFGDLEKKERKQVCKGTINESDYTITGRVRRKANYLQLLSPVGSSCGYGNLQST